MSSIISTELNSAIHTPWRISGPDSPVRRAPTSWETMGITAMVMPVRSMNAGQSTAPPKLTPAKSAAP